MKNLSNLQFFKTVTRETVPRWPALLGWSCLTLYISWNCYWLFQGAFAPSILVWLFDIPAPTTGMTRSTMALLNANFVESFYWNPFTIPTIILFLYSLSYFLKSLISKKEYLLPRAAIYAWMILLPLAWISKFIIGPAWW